MTTIFKRQSCRCRCNRACCQSRRTLPKHPDDYVRAPKCRACGKGVYRLDKFRTDGREHAGKTCLCSNYSFPHRRGSGYCTHNPHLTAEVMRERYESGAWA